MNAKTILTILMLLFAATPAIAFNGSGTIGDPYQVTTCAIINQSGYYAQQNDIIVDGDLDPITSTEYYCINIKTSDVYYDGQNFLIEDTSGGGNAYSYGATTNFQSGQYYTNVTLENINVTDDWFDAEAYYNGFVISNSEINNYLYVGSSGNEQEFSATITGNNIYGINDPGYDYEIFDFGFPRYENDVNNDIVNGTILIQDNSIIGGDLVSEALLAFGAQNYGTLIPPENVEEIKTRDRPENVIIDNNEFISSNASAINWQFVDITNFNASVPYVENFQLTNNFFNVTNIGQQKVYFTNALIENNTWTNPSGTGFSQTCTNDGNGFCVEDYLVYNNTELDIQYYDTNPVALTTAPCTPDWVCNGYESGVCPESEEFACNSVVDNNACGETYSGDYSEFAGQACTYISPVEQKTSNFNYLAMIFLVVGVFGSILTSVSNNKAFKQKFDWVTKISIIIMLLGVVGLVIL